MSHPHNLFLELAYSYGIPLGLTIFLPIIFILIKSFRKIVLNNNKYDLFDQGWFTAFAISLWMQTNDLTYFDARMSLSFWILLSGLRNILRKSERKDPFKTKSIDL